MCWKIVERPGYLGKKRNECYSLWDQKYGKGNWKISFFWDNKIISKEEGIKIYEDAYYEYFKNNPLILEWLTKRASDIYDTALTNIHSKLDYNIQETENNHIHDIAIKKAVLRNGHAFVGDHIVQIRWVESEGFLLNPGIVPFHKPEMILKEDINDYGNKGFWWKKNTIEDFYQKNKVLLVKNKENGVVA